MTLCYGGWPRQTSTYALGMHTHIEGSGFTPQEEPPPPQGSEHGHAGLQGSVGMHGLYIFLLSC